MLHLDFSDFTLIEQLVIPELEGITRATIHENTAIVFGQFCKNTMAFREYIDIPVNPESLEYMLFTPHEGTQVIGVFLVEIEGKAMLPGDYHMDSPEYLVLSEKPNSNSSMRVGLVLMPSAGNQTAPTSILNRWAHDIAEGVKARLMMMPAMPWSNPQLGAFYKNEYEQSELSAAADIRNEFSVTRKARTHRPQSFYW